MATYGRPVAGTYGPGACASRLRSVPTRLVLSQDTYGSWVQNLKCSAVAWSDRAAAFRTAWRPLGLPWSVLRSPPRRFRRDDSRPLAAFEALLLTAIGSCSANALATSIARMNCTGTDFGRN
jgi:hypothetical protein